MKRLMLGLLVAMGAAAFATGAEARNCRNGVIITPVKVFTSCDQMRQYLAQIDIQRARQLARIKSGAQKRYDKNQRDAWVWQQTAQMNIDLKRNDMLYGSALFAATKLRDKYAMDLLNKSIGLTLAKGGRVTKEQRDVLEAVSAKLTGLGSITIDAANKKQIDALEVAMDTVQANLGIIKEVAKLNPYVAGAVEAIDYGKIAIETGFKIANDKVDLDYYIADKKIADQFADKMYWDAPLTQLKVLDATEAQLRNELGEQQIDYDNRFGGVLVMVEAVESGAAMDDISSDILKLKTD